jgi:hypothetical protein
LFSITIDWPRCFSVALASAPHADVGRAARRPRHDQGHGPCGKLLRLREAGEQRQSRGEQNRLLHKTLPVSQAGIFRLSLRPTMPNDGARGNGDILWRIG